MFKSYNSKPIQRLSCLILAAGVLAKVPDAEATWTYTFEANIVEFKAHQTPVVGDYIVYLNDDDVYHVDAKTFAEHNITGDTVVHAIHDGEARAAFVDAILATATHAYTRLPDSQFTICVTSFADGWSVTGQSVCVNPDDYNEDLGQSIAAQNALSDASTHYWRTCGYLAMIGHTEINYAA